MNKFKFKIDEKSLFYGMYNDYERGQTASVHTPINQSNNPKNWHNDILELCKHNLELKNIPDRLMDKCLPHTTSQSGAKINNIFVFDKILIDGVKLDCSSSFIMYIKEETDKMIKNRKGKMVQNTHYGRMKLHYPQNFLFKSDGLNIDNKSVLDAILQQNGNFAYVVRMFEYDLENKTLNFITTIIGLKGIFLSNVFKKQKGVGKKLLLKELNLEEIDFQAQDIDGDSTSVIMDRKREIADLSVFDKANKTKVENGKIGEKIILEQLSENKNATDIYHTSNDFSTSPYDIEYYENGVKKYVEVKCTQGNKKVFNMSNYEIKFMKRYKEDYILFLITNVKDKVPNIYMFTCDKILQLKYEHPTTRFYA